MKILQINLNHCEAAQELLTQTVYEKKIDVVIISEQYKNTISNTWVSDNSKKAAIWICGDKTIQDNPLTNKPFYTRAKVGGIHFYSCYLPPSLSQPEFEKVLDELVRDVRTTNPNIIAGDFNAWALEWGSRSTNHRGQALLKAFCLLDVILLNTGGRNTFEKNGRGSIIDITFASKSLARTTEWQVCDTYTHSDHFAIIIDVGKHSVIEKRSALVRKVKTKGWKEDTIDEDLFKHMLTEDIPESGDINEMAKLLVQHICRACDASMIRKKQSFKRKPAYWWNSEIYQLRIDSNKARRKYQRGAGTVEHESLRENFKSKRKMLKKAIKASKASCFKELCNKLDENPWGGAYKLVMSKVRGPKGQAPTCPTLLKHVVETLFPTQNTYEEELLPLGEVEPVTIPNVTETEVINAAARFGNAKAPGLDGIPNRALKIAIKQTPKSFIKVFEKCLTGGVFPKIWKKQRLVLLQKPNKTVGDPSAYRPLCMIDTIGKILERLICERLETHLEEVEDGLSSNQYGFRKKRSTTDAIKTLTGIAEKAIEGTRWMHGTKKYCAIITFDVKNAFNSAYWPHIIHALVNLETPVYLLRIIRSYLSDRLLFYDTDEGTKSYAVTGGVPQGSVLGPVLWNILYDGILRLPLSKEAKIIGYADDIAVAIVAKELHQIQSACVSTSQKIKNWLDASRLQLARQKTEAVLITSRKKVETITLNIDGYTITTQPSLKYLGVIIDARLNYKSHIEKTCEKAARVISALSRIMANIGGPNQDRRLLLSKTSQSIALYAAPVWAQALGQKAYARMLNSLFRLSAIRVASAFRTVSQEAVSVIAGIMPPDLIALELKRIYDSSKMLGRPLTIEERKEERQKSLREWQNRWDATTKGRWTHRLINNVETWVNRNHGYTDFYMTQFLTGHGCFREYLYKYGHDNGVMCSFCGNENENALHIFFYCPRYNIERSQIEQQIAERLSPDNIVLHMLRSKQVWLAVKKLTAEVLTELRKMERIRKAESRALNRGEIQ